jgi:hypothetical protein
VAEVAPSASTLVAAMAANVRFAVVSIAFSLRFLFIF